MTQWQSMMREESEKFPESEFADDGEEILNNEERGCGHLDEGKGYLRSDVAGPGGNLPPMVEIPSEMRIPFKEEHFRTWKTFPGIQFELALIEEAAGLDAESASPMEYVAAIKNGGHHGGEIWEHLKRLAGSAHPLDAGMGGSDHYGTMRVAQANDIIMWVGETYYPQPEDFIEEAQERGLNKAISMSTRNPPPVINPGKTRLFLIHPKGIDNYPEKDEEELDEMGIEEDDRYTSAIIGYAYITRCIYTEDADGRIPDYIERWEAANDLDVVSVGREISFEEMENESFEDAASETEAAEGDDD
jgi:hypothetical protein